MADKGQGQEKGVKVVARVRPPGHNELTSDVIVYCDSTGKNVTVDV